FQYVNVMAPIAFFWQRSRYLFDPVADHALNTAQAMEAGACISLNGETLSRFLEFSLCCPWNTIPTFRRETVFYFFDQRVSRESTLIFDAEQIEMFGFIPQIAGYFNNQDISLDKFVH